MKPTGRPESALGAHLNGTVWGALGGALAIIPLFAVFLIIPWGVPPLRELPYALGNLLLFSGFAFFVAYIGYFLGALLLGYPVRRALERLGHTGAGVAALVGGGLSGLATWLIVGLGASSMSIAAMAAVAGAVTGIVYRRASET